MFTPQTKEDIIVSAPKGRRSGVRDIPKVWLSQQIEASYLICRICTSPQNSQHLSTNHTKLHVSRATIGIPPSPLPPLSLLSPSNTIHSSLFPIVRDRSNVFPRDPVQISSLDAVQGRDSNSHGLLASSCYGHSRET